MFYNKLSLYMKKIVLILAGFCGLLAVSLSFAASTIAPIQSLNGIAAVVNGEIITQQALNTETAMLKQQMQAANQPVPSDSKLKKQVLNQMIDQKLVLQMAVKDNVSVSSAQVDATIANIAKQNNLTVAQLQQQIAKQGMNYDVYKAQIKQQLLMNGAEQQAIGNTIQVTDAEVQLAMKKAAKQNQAIPEYHLQALLVPVPNAPTPAQLQVAKAQANALIQKLQKGADFSTLAISQSAGSEALQGGDLGWKQLTQLPPSIAAQVAGAINGTILGPIQSPNGFYIVKVVGFRTLNANHTISLTHVRHILLKQGMTETGDQVKAKLAVIRQQIEKGTAFDVMAEKYSEDAATAKKGGDLGWVAADELPANLVKSMQHLKVGQVSKPIRTKDGWELIQVLGRKNVNNSQANLENQTRQMLYFQKFQQAVKNWVQQLRGKAYIKIMQ